MNICLYEFLTSGGIYSLTKNTSLSVDAPSAEVRIAEVRAAEVRAALMAEGDAMVNALLQDFSSIPDLSLTLLRDVKCPPVSYPACRIIEVSNASEESELLLAQAELADLTLIIAPEFDRILLTRVGYLFEIGVQLLNSPHLIPIFSNKSLTSSYLTSHGIPNSRNLQLSVNKEFMSFIFKPVDGAGSMDVYQFDIENMYESIVFCDAEKVTESDTLIEPFHAGTSVSIAFLCGPNQRLALSPCLQLIEKEAVVEIPEQLKSFPVKNLHQLHYVGGTVPIDPKLAERAINLGTRVIETLDHPLGYIGIDLILGETEDQDVVVEINPRITTSYVGLSKLCEQNLGEAMLKIATGEAVSLSFRSTPLTFRSDGQCFPD